jgi:hypothetical protein
MSLPQAILISDVNAAAAADQACALGVWRFCVLFEQE